MSLSDASAVPTYLLSTFAAQSVKMVLGSDEADWIGGRLILPTPIPLSRRICSEKVPSNTLTSGFAGARKTARYIEARRPLHALGRRTVRPRYKEKYVVHFPETRVLCVGSVFVTPSNRK
jgi:hypothetical protein